jgi:ketosteroid isomerase-like protein
MNNDLQTFKEFLKTRERASRAYMSGDAGPVTRITTKTHNASFFSPQGEYVVGRKNVVSAFQKGAMAFKSVIENAFEALHMGADNGIAYWIGLQHTKVKMKDEKEVQFHLRLTELFEREEHEWKLVHRHADSLALNAS